MGRRNRNSGMYQLRNGLLVPSLVKSVQAGTIAITGATSNTATVTAVNVANAVLIWLGNRLPVASGGYRQLNARLELTNPTTVTATVNTDPGPNTTTVSFVLVEFFSGVLRSVQRGTITGATTATITAVNTKKSFLVPLGQTTDNSVGDTSQAATLELTDATTVTQAGGGAGTVSGYQVVEFL
jgi:hypothetical protein